MIRHPDRVKSRINQSICDKYCYQVYWKSQGFTGLSIKMTKIKLLIINQLKNEK